MILTSAANFKVSVVICTRNRPSSLERCLTSIARLDYHDFDVLVVDNAPTDRRTAEVCRERRINYLVEPDVGLSRARNRGARECTSDVIAYIDDDATADPMWLSALVPEFADPKVMVVTGAILPPEGMPSASSGPASQGPRQGRATQVLDCGTPNWFEMANFGGIGSGGNMCFRRAVFNIWPGFDVRLGRGATLYAGEDDYAFFRIIELGYRVVFCPTAVVYHRRIDESQDGGNYYKALLTGLVAYALFLQKKAPRYRRVIAWHFLQGLVGRSRSWRTGPDPGISAARRSLLKLTAAVHGFVLYGRSWRGSELSSQS